MDQLPCASASVSRYTASSSASVSTSSVLVTAKATSQSVWPEHESLMTRVHLYTDPDLTEHSQYVSQRPLLPC